jgi:hypothetical protein
MLSVFPIVRPSDAWLGLILGNIVKRRLPHAESHVW